VAIIDEETNNKKPRKQEVLQ